MIEIVLLAIRHDWRLAIRAEILSLVLIVAAYPLLVWFFTPVFFSDIIPLVLLTYAAYDIPTIEILTRKTSMLTLGTLTLSALALSRNPAGRPAVIIWIAASQAGVLTYLIQSKGFAYHLLPALSFALISLLIQFPAARGLYRVAIPVFSATAAIAPQTQLVMMQQVRQAYFERFFEGMKPGTIMSLSYDLGTIFPYPDGLGWNWTDHFQSLWPLPAVAKSMLTLPDRKMVVNLTGGFVAQDFARNPPDYVIVDMQKDTPTLRGNKLDYIALLSETPDFAAAWQNYQWVRTLGYLRLWRRKDAPTD